MGRQLRFKGSHGTVSPKSSNDTPTSDTEIGQRSGANTGAVDVFGLLRLLFLNRRWLTAAIVTAGVVTAIATLFIPNQYTSHASLLPSKGGGKLSALKGITGLAALDIAGGFGGSSEGSSELFPTTLNSARLRDVILKKRYHFFDGDKKIELSMQEYLGEPNIDKARNLLAKLTVVGSEFKTGVVTLDVTTRYPELSAQVAQAYIDELDKFNRTQRKTRATEYERFLHDRLAVSDTAMRSAENALEEFQRVNRDWAFSNDPALQKQLMSLKRDLEIKTKTFALLTQQYEIAKNETRKDLPVVQALDAPMVPLVKSAPQRTLMVIFAMLIAAVFGVSVIIIRESFTKRIADPGSDSWRSLQTELQRSYPRLAKRIASRSRLKAEATESHERESRNAHEAPTGV